MAWCVFVDPVVIHTECLLFCQANWFKLVEPLLVCTVQDNITCQLSSAIVFGSIGNCPHSYKHLWYTMLPTNTPGSYNALLVIPNTKYTKVTIVSPTGTSRYPRDKTVLGSSLQPACKIREQAEIALCSKSYHQWWRFLPYLNDPINEFSLGCYSLPYETGYSVRMH